LEILYFDKLDSTHKFLLRKIKEKEISPPVLVTAKEQTDGIGTRGKSWISIRGNLFLSMAISKKSLPKDLPLQSVSIYYAYLFKELLASFGSKVWLKWPNDLYLDDKKIGGILTQIVGDTLIVSIGLNVKKSPKKFKTIDISLDKSILVEEFVLKVKEVVSWKKIFSKYQVEFSRSRAFETTQHKNGKKILLKDAVLDRDGSIKIYGERIYSKDE